MSPISVVLHQNHLVGTAKTVDIFTTKGKGLFLIASHYLCLSSTTRRDSSSHRAPTGATPGGADSDRCDPQLCGPLMDSP